jgi:hypothetical protein
MRKLVLTLSALALAIGAGCSRSDDRRFWDLSEKGGWGQGGVPVLLTVKSNPPAEVIVLPHDPEQRQPINLGRTPLDKASGARVGDTIILEERSLCLRWPVPLEFGEPFKEKVIEKDFGVGSVRVQTHNNADPKLRVWCSGFELGKPDTSLKLSGGDHLIELRSEGGEPISTRVKITDQLETTLWLSAEESAVP